MLTKSEKAKVVQELADRFGRQRLSMFTDIRGISVAKLSAFRRELKALGAELKVAKKTLLQRAIQAAGSAAGAIEPQALDGEIGVIFGYEDQIAPARAAAKFAKENETFKILKGLLAGAVIETREVLALATLPSREALLGRLAFTLNAPLRGLAAVLTANIRNLVVVLNNVSGQKLKG